jgi:cyanophycinase
MPGNCRWIVAGLILLSALRAAPVLASTRETKGGSLVIIGGGHRPESITQKFIELAGGSNAARVIVIGLASEDSAGAARGSIEEFKAHGLAQVEALPPEVQQAAQALRKATGVYFTGGDQQKLVDAMAGTSLPREIGDVWRRGGVIGGTSAGAAVMSEKMITGEERGNPPDDQRFRSIQQEQIAITNGFGFITNAIVDQHFIKRRRLNRLFSVVLENPNLLGIGIDESTAVVVGPNQVFEVFGEGQVMVIDARHASRVRTAPDRRMAADDLRVHIFLPGDRFDIKTGRTLHSPR